MLSIPAVEFKRSRNFWLAPNPDSSHSFPRLVCPISPDALRTPIFTPSLTRSSKRKHGFAGYLGLESALLRKDFVQIICVRSEEFDAYREDWPRATIFRLPKSNSSRGIGATRQWMKKLAEKICPDEFRFVFVLDDSVRSWKGQTLAKDPCNIFAPHQQVLQDRSSFMSISLWRVIRHFETGVFAGDQGDLSKFAVVGFFRYSSRNNCRVAYKRTQVYSAVFLNLTVLEELEIEYRDIYCWEDLKFNLEVSGMDAPWNPAPDPTVGGVIVKCQRFAMYKPPIRGGGCSAALKTGAGAESEQPEETVGQKNELQILLEEFGLERYVGLFQFHNYL